MADVVNLPNPAPMTIVCTDRGRHPRIVLARVEVTAGRIAGTVHPDAPREQNPVRWLHMWEHDGHRTGMAQCPRCGREQRRREEVWVAAAMAGVSRLDISRMP